MPSVSDSNYDTPVQSPMNGSYKTQNGKEAGSFMTGATKNVNGQHIQQKVMAAASGAVENASAYVDQFKDHTSAFYQSHIKPNLPERGSVDLNHLNENVNKFTAAVREQIAHLDQNEIKEKYADLAHQYYNLLLESYQHQLEEVQKNGGWKAVPSRVAESGKVYASWAGDQIATASQNRPLFGFFTLVFAGLAAVPILAYAAFSAATVVTSATVAATSATLVLGGAGVLLSIVLFFAAVSAAVAALTIAGTTFAFQQSKQAVRNLGVYAHREEEAGRIIATVEKGEEWVSSRYNAAQSKALSYLQKAENKAGDAKDAVEHKVNQQQSKKRK